MSDTHRCLAASACRNGERGDDERVGAPTEKPNTLCPVCFKAIESAIRQLPRDWADLRKALGERTAIMNSKIRSTPTPAIPISTRKEALMAAIVETCERAAAVVSEQLHTDPPETRRNAPLVFISEEMQKLLWLPESFSAKLSAPLPNTVAFNAVETVKPEAGQRLAAAVRMVEPNIDLLASAPTQTFSVWDKFGEDNRQPTIRDPETGEPISTRGRIFVDLSGMDIALQLADLHHQCRAELGLRRLRHRYPMPCPRCGGRVGRDDGQSIVTCDDRADCKASWTEREYQFLAGLITRERLDMEITKWLLAEAYERLDTLAEAADMIRQNKFLDTDAAGGRYVLDIVDGALKGHKLADERAITTDRSETEQRQSGEDAWAWENESPYRPPKRKPCKTAKPPENPIHPASLSTLVDLSEDVDAGSRIACPQCHLAPCDCA